MRFFAFWGFIKMNILIVGNGFDLSHYLPTKYDHFMVAMNAIEKWDETRGNMTFDDVFCSLYEQEAYFFKYTKSIYDTTQIVLISDDIRKIKIRLENNIWYKYFKFYRSRTETWIDLEKKIEEGLECCSNFFELIGNKINENSKISYMYKELSQRSDSGSVKLHSRDIHILSLLRILCIKRLVSSEPIFQWADIDFPKGLYTLQSSDRRIINNDFMSENGGYMTYDYNKAINHLYENLEDFIFLFNFYLISFVNSLNSNENNFKKLECNPDYVYSFNYSKTIERLYRGLSSINYLHGKSDEEESKLVLGISDLNASFLKKYKAYGFTKYHQKLLKKTDYIFLKFNEKNVKNSLQWNLWDIKRFSVESLEVNHRTNIFIWGHSLDISDDVYISEVFSLNYNDEDKNVRVVVYYFNEQANFDLLANLIHILGKEKVELWMKKGWLKFEKNPDIAKINDIEPVELPRMIAQAS